MPRNCCQLRGSPGVICTNGRSPSTSKVGSEISHTAAEGDGPVNALDAALRKAIGGHYPQLDRIHLTDFKVRVLNTNKGTGAVTRVLLDSTDGTRTWTTMGVSDNIIEASWQALVDSIVYGLLHGGRPSAEGDPAIS